MKQAILLLNLGSPDSPSIADVRRYLREFLMDEQVIDLPFLSRWALVHLIILPFRPRKSAEAYRKIWWPEGSPLTVLSQRLRAALQPRFEAPVVLAMRYQNPSIESVVKDLLQRKTEEIVVAPLYPQYALSSYETGVARVREVVNRLGSGLKLKIVPPFYNDPDYLRAWVASAKEYLARDYDHLLFSFHGLPERHMRKADPTGSTCLASADCCQTPSPVHRTCYRAQAFSMMNAFVQQTGLPQEKFSISFQSRLGREHWLRPYTDHLLQELPAKGVRKLLVICPAFVADCLETLEEIGLRGRATFLQAGGQELTLIPCLNDQPVWVEALEKIIRRAAGEPKTQ